MRHRIDIDSEHQDLAVLHKFCKKNISLQIYNRLANYKILVSDLKNVEIFPDEE